MEDDKLQMSKSIDDSKLYVKKQLREFLCLHAVLYEYMNLLRNDVYNLFITMHVGIKIYLEFNTV